MSGRHRGRRVAKTPRVAFTLCLSASVTLLTFLYLGSASAASPPTPAPFWQACSSGEAAGNCFVPRGIAASPNTGHLYVVDQGNSRVVEMTAWGGFVKAWGRGVKDGSPEAQICDEETECRSGSKGSGAGEFRFPQGIALDSVGNIYVADMENHRIQKFDPQGGFLLTFGGGVDQTDNGNICTGASGHTCGAGTIGSGSGEFGPWEFGSLIAVGPADTVYVGDNQRVQEFDSGGSFVKSIPLPGELVQSLAVDSVGNIFLSRFKENFFGTELSKNNVLKLGPAGEALCTAIVNNPRAITTDPGGNIYVASGTPDDPQTILSEVEIHKFTPACVEVSGYSFSLGKPAAQSETFASTGIATNVVTQAGEIGLYYANLINTNSFIRSYGLLPTGRCPSISHRRCRLRSPISSPSPLAKTARSCERASIHTFGMIRRTTSNTGPRNARKRLVRASRPHRGNSCSTNE
jgi:DNA-binding beta-propeller fold protein YncE